MGSDQVQNIGQTIDKNQEILENSLWFIQN